MLKKLLVVCFCIIIFCLSVIGITFSAFQIKTAKNLKDANYNNVKADYEALREHPDYKDWTLKQYIEYVDNIESPPYWNWKYSKVSFGRKNLKLTILSSSIQIFISVLLVILTITYSVLYIKKRK
jgi:predicted PurR-regulated permease PerM